MAEGDKRRPCFFFFFFKYIFLETNMSLSDTNQQTEWQDDLSANLTDSHIWNSRFPLLYLYKSGKRELNIPLIIDFGIFNLNLFTKEFHRKISCLKLE